MDHPVASSVVRRSCAAAGCLLPALVAPPLAHPLVDLGLSLQPLDDLDDRLLLVRSITRLFCYFALNFICSEAFIRINS